MMTTPIATDVPITHVYESMQIPRISSTFANPRELDRWIVVPVDRLALDHEVE